MTTPIAPANGTMAMRISERRQRQQPEGGAGKDGREAQSGPQQEAPHQPSPAAEAPPPPLDENPVPAETLFAASLMADRLARPQSVTEAKAFTSHGWEPPDSPLRLTDKKI